MTGSSIAAGLGLIVFLCIIVLAIFWIALPFLVNATNTRLDKALDELRAIRRVLEERRPPAP